MGQTCGCEDLYCEDVIKSKLVYIVLMRPKIRPKHVSAITQLHVKNHFHDPVSSRFCCERSTHIL